jgi:glycyl-tRNA synthetase beta chain
VLGDIVNQAIAALPIAKRMRWGARTAEFVRPVRTVVLLFGETVVPIEVLGFKSDRMTLGHRFHAPKPFLKSAKSYEGQLHRAKVVADFAKRRELIRAACALQRPRPAGATAHIEDALLDEVTALVEWPVPIAGRFEERFLACRARWSSRPCRNISAILRWKAATAS